MTISCPHRIECPHCGFPQTTVKNNRQFFAAPGNGSPIRLADAPGGNYERISADTKCLSAQWDANGEGTGVGADAAGVLCETLPFPINLPPVTDMSSDTCVFGANAASSSSVGADKQKWLFVPTDYDDGASTSKPFYWPPENRAQTLTPSVQILPPIVDIANLPLPI